MPRVSPRALKKELSEEIVNNLWWVFGQIKFQPEVVGFIQSITTQEERVMLAKRLAILYMLSKGYHYSDISEALKVTPATIGKMRMILEYRKPQLEKVLKMLDRYENSKKLGQRLDRIFEDIGLVLASKTNMRARAELTRRGFSR